VEPGNRCGMDATTGYSSVSFATIVSPADAGTHPPGSAGCIHSGEATKPPGLPKDLSKGAGKENNLPSLPTHRYPLVGGGQMTPWTCRKALYSI